MAAFDHIKASVGTIYAELTRTPQGAGVAVLILENQDEPYLSGRLLLLPSLPPPLLTRRPLCVSLLGCSANFSSDYSVDPSSSMPPALSSAQASSSTRCRR